MVSADCDAIDAVDGAHSAGSKCHRVDLGVAVSLVHHHTLDHVDIAPGGNGMEHIALRDLTAVGEVRHFKPCRHGDDLRQVEQNAPHTRMSTEHSGECCAMSATDINECSHLGKVTGVNDGSVV